MYPHNNSSAELDAKFSVIGVGSATTRPHYGLLGITFSPYWLSTLVTCRDKLKIVCLGVRFTNLGCLGCQNSQRNIGRGRDPTSSPPRVTLSSVYVFVNFFRSHNENPTAVSALRYPFLCIMKKEFPAQSQNYYRSPGAVVIITS